MDEKFQQSQTVSHQAKASRRDVTANSRQVRLQRQGLTSAAFRGDVLARALRDAERGEALQQHNKSWPVVH